MSQFRTNKHALPKSLARRDLPPLGAHAWDQAATIYTTTSKAIVEPGPIKPSVVSSAHGAIDHLMLTYPTYAAGEYGYRTIYEDLLRKLPVTTRFTFLCHRSVQSDLVSMIDAVGATKRTDIVLAPQHLQFLVWAEDPYIAVTDLAAGTQGATYLIKPFTFRRAGDSLIADLIASATAVRSTQSPLYFQGGNVLIGDDFILMGNDYPQKTFEVIKNEQHIVVPSGTNANAFIHDLYVKTFDACRTLTYVGTDLNVPCEERRTVELQGETWTEVLFAGTGETQPIFHIDMFISLAGRGTDGRYRLLLGSPTEADRILKQPSSDSTIRLSPLFDDVASSLVKIGFDVIRNPLPITYVDDLTTRTRFWYFATANNCLVQIAGEQKMVWLPTYGHQSWSDLRVVDEENQRIWKSLGFDVMELGDFHPFVQNLGSVHCIKKYLSRTL